MRDHLAIDRIGQQVNQRWHISLSFNHRHATDGTSSLSSTGTDPVFGTQFMRVTDPGRLLAPGMSRSAAYCRHRYSSTQAWNADQSLFAIFNGCEGICFLDGRTYQPAFHRSNADDCNWSPTDPALMICVHANQLYTWAPRTNAITVVFAPSEYRKLEFGPNKGTPSSDGWLVVLRATDRSGHQTAFAYDIAVRKKYPDINLGSLPGKNGYCGISPFGRYIRLQSRANASDPRIYASRRPASYPPHYQVKERAESLAEPAGSPLTVPEFRPALGRLKKMMNAPAR